MNVPKETKDVMTRYLLGLETPVEQAALEDSYAADTEVFEQLVAIENDLADRYVRRQLTDAEHAAFERHVLAHPQRRARAQFAGAFSRHVNEVKEELNVCEPSPRAASFSKQVVQWWQSGKGTWGWTFGFAVIVLLTLGGWWMWKVSRPTVPIEIAKQPNAAGSPTPVNMPVASPLPETTPTESVKAAPAFVTLALNAGLVRGNENADVSTLTIPPNTDEVRLRLKADVNGYARYRLTLQRAEGKALRNIITTIKSGTLVFTVPAGLLADGEYFVTVSGLNPNGEADALSKAIFRVNHRYNLK